MTKWADGVTGIIYGLYDNTGLRYIGQTTCAPRVRLQAHIAGYSKAKDSPRVRWLRGDAIAGRGADVATD